MTVRKPFEFKKTYEEVELIGNTYKVDFRDEKILQYQKSFSAFYEEAKRVQEVDTSKISVEEQHKLFFDLQKLVKKLVEELLGKGTYEVLYEASDKSLMNMLDLCSYLGDIVGDRINRIKDDRKKKYTHKKNI